MFLRNLLVLALSTVPAIVSAQKPLPPLRDGAVVAGPGHFRHDGELLVQGQVTLKKMTLDLHGPIRVAAGATLKMEDVQLVVSDPVGKPNGTSGLRCEGPAHIIVRNSAMFPAGSAHPMWLLKGDLDVDGFETTNSEFHLDKVKARLDKLKIFELEISHESQVTARRLDLVFLSTHTGENDHLRFADIPVDRDFTQTLALGSGARAEISESRMQFFLLYVHGGTDAELAHMDRVQLAISPQCDGTLRLPRGRLGSATTPAVFPEPGSSNCPFHISLNDVNVDTWDIYASGNARLTFDDSQIDELVAGDHAEITVRKSNIYADWLAVSANAKVNIENSTVGALRLANQRRDLATSQIRVSGKGVASFSTVQFDCGIVASDDAIVSISHAVAPPKYLRHSGNSVIRVDGVSNSPAN
jgi:hypothetical protein